jgi:hypothetical protein
MLRRVLSLHRIEGTRREPVPVAGKLVDHPLAVDLVLGRMMEDMQSHQSGKQVAMLHGPIFAKIFRLRIEIPLSSVAFAEAIPNLQGWTAQRKEGGRASHRLGNSGHHSKGPMLFRSYQPRAPLSEFVEDIWLYEDYAGAHRPGIARAGANETLCILSHSCRTSAAIETRYKTSASGGISPTAMRAKKKEPPHRAPRRRSCVQSVADIGRADSANFKVSSPPHHSLEIYCY